MPSDLTICYNSTDGTASAGGYKLENVLLNQGISPMTTINGGGNTKKKGKERVSDVLLGLAVPAGLLCLPGEECTKLSFGDVIDKGIVEEDLYNRLLKLAEDESRHPRRKTRSKRPRAMGTRRRH